MLEDRRKSHPNNHLKGRISQSALDVYNYGHAPKLLDFIVENTKSGTVEQPAMLLEIGGGQSKKNYPAAALNKKNIITGNIDLSPQWGDRVFTGDVNAFNEGLFDPGLNNFFEGTFLSAVVISNTIKFFKGDKLKELFASTIALLPPGGSLIIHDVKTDPWIVSSMQKNTDGLYEVAYGMLLPALECLKELARKWPSDFTYKSYFVGPVVNFSNAFKIESNKADLFSFSNYLRAEIYPKGSAVPGSLFFQVPGNRYGLLALSQETTVFTKVNPV
jgi:hypothetical protein